MRRPLVVLLLILALLASGCSSRITPSSTSGTSSQGLVPIGHGETNQTADGNGTGVKPSPATMNLTRDPVDIQESGDLTQGASKDWTWHAAPGFTTFNVELVVNGPQGSAAYELVNYDIRMAGGDPAQETINKSGGNNLAGGTAGPCFYCFDGTTAGPNIAGPWSLHFDAGPSAATYTLHITVGYG